MRWYVHEVVCTCDEEVHTYTYKLKRHTEIAGEASRFKRNHGAREYQAFTASRSENTKVILLEFFI